MHEINSERIVPFDELDQAVVESDYDRIQSPVDTRLKKGERVEIKVGPAKGKMGTIEKERNGNYVNKSSAVDDESIAVKVDGEPELRWFDSPDQLELELESEVE